jgi:hypothetical protein
MTYEATTNAGQREAERIEKVRERCATLRAIALAGYEPPKPLLPSQRKPQP